jgi:hypothetical protein
MTHDEMFNSLHAKFPNLINEQTLIDFDVGWYKLTYDYCLMMEKLVKNKICKHTPISGIKEKWGKMDIHHSIDTDETGVGFDICQAVQFYIENKSKHTCEKCGKWGEIDCDNGWLRCLCGECKGGKND